MDVIKKRAGFLKIAKYGSIAKTKSVVVLGMRSSKSEFGFTASKRVGKAVLRNRAKRRLRHLAMDMSNNPITSGFSFVCIANFRTPIIDFQNLKYDFYRAITQVVQLGQDNVYNSNHKAVSKPH